MIGRHNHYCSQKYIFYLFKKKSCIVDYLWLYYSFSHMFRYPHFSDFSRFLPKDYLFLRNLNFFFFNLKNSTTSKLKLLLTLKPNEYYMQVANTIFHPRKN